MDLPRVEHSSDKSAKADSSDEENYSDSASDIDLREATDPIRVRRKHNFIPSQTFTGQRGRYDFKLGPRGIGFYHRHGFNKTKATLA